MSDHDTDGPLPVDSDPFQGLMGKRQLNPALEIATGPVMAPVEDGPPPPDPRLAGYVSRDDLPVSINFRTTKRVRDALKIAAATRGVPMADMLNRIVSESLGLPLP